MSVLMGSELEPHRAMMPQCSHAGGWGLCPNTATTGSLCDYHDMAARGVVQNGAESRSNPSQRATWRVRPSRANPERAATLRGGPAQNGRAGGRTKYPWADWFDGAVHVLTTGTDFDVSSPYNMAQLIRRTADAHNYSASVRTQGNTVIITPQQGAVA